MLYNCVLFITKILVDCSKYLRLTLFKKQQQNLQLVLVKIIFYKNFKVRKQQKVTVQKNNRITNNNTI